MRHLFFAFFLFLSFLNFSGCQTLERGASSESRDAQADALLAESQPPAAVETDKQKVDQAQPGFPQEPQASQ